MLIDWFNFLEKLTFRKIINYLKNKVAYFLSVIFQKPVILGYPSVASIEPINSCNLKCPECPVGNDLMTRSTGAIETSLCRKLIDELSPRLSYLMLYFMGEPLLHPQFISLIEYSTSKKIYTVTSTNGHFLNIQYAKEIVKSGLDRLIVSMDGIDQESYEKFRQHGDFNRVIEGIANVVQMKQKLRSRVPYIILQFIAMRHNEKQINEIKRTGKRLGADKIVVKSLQVKDFSRNAKLIPENKKFSRYKKGKDNKYIIKKKLQNHCRRLWETMVILNDGCIVPCCFDKDGEFVFGRYPENGIYDLWKGMQFNLFRQRILNSRKDIEMCCNCIE